MDDIMEQALTELVAAIDADVSSERRYQILAILFDEDDREGIRVETSEDEVLH